MDEKERKEEEKWEEKRRRKGEGEEIAQCRAMGGARKKKARGQTERGGMERSGQ